MTDRTAEIAAMKAMLAQLTAREGPAPTVEEVRQSYDAWGLSNPLPDGHSVTPEQIGGVSCERHDAGNGSPAVILYLHGGGYALGSLDSHRHLVAQLALAAGSGAVAVDYRLAPEHAFPAAVDDAVAVYETLLAQGVAASSIVIAGDSAGGGLTMATALALKAKSIALPAGLFCISPWVNLAQTGASYAAMAAHDMIVTKESLDTWAQLYLADRSPADPLASGRASTGPDPCRVRGGASV
jgi:epsilon-lactone hydrolase